MEVVIEPVGGRQDDVSGIVNQSFQSDESRDQEDPDREEDEEEGEEDPDDDRSGDREHTLRGSGRGSGRGSPRERARRREAARRRKKNTKWAMCLYIMPAALVLLGLMIAIIVLQVVYFLEGKELDKVKAEIEAQTTLAPLPRRTLPTDMLYSTARATPITRRSSYPPTPPTATGPPTRAPSPETLPPDNRAFNGGDSEKPEGPGGNDALPFPTYIPPPPQGGASDVTPLDNPPIGNQPAQPLPPENNPVNGNGNERPGVQNPNARSNGERELPPVDGGPAPPGERGPAGEVGPVGPMGPLPPGVDPPRSNGDPLSSSTTTEQPVASIEAAATPEPEGPALPDPGPGGGQVAHVIPPEITPFPPTTTPGPTTLPTTTFLTRPTKDYRLTTTFFRSTIVTTGPPPRPSTSALTTPTTTTTTTTKPPKRTEEPMDGTMVKRIEDRQENLRSLLIWLILVLFGVGIILIVGAYAIYKGWCCKYDLKAKTETSGCFKLCCKPEGDNGSNNSRRNSPQEMIGMDEIQRNRSDSHDIQTDVEITEDEREQTEDETEAEDRSHSNRRRTRGSRTQRSQNRTTGEVTQIFIIQPQGCEPPPSYEESVGPQPVTSNQGQNQGQSEISGSAPRNGSSEEVNSSIVPVGPHVTRLGSLPTYEDSLAHSSITISPEQINQLTNGGSIPARARVFMLRSENRPQTVSSARYHARPQIPSNLMGIDYVSTARRTRTPPRRDRRSPHRNRSSPEVNNEVSGERSNRSTPRSNRSTPRSHRSRSNGGDRGSPRGSNNRTLQQTSSVSRPRERSQRSPSNGGGSRNARQGNQRQESGSSPSPRSGRSPSSSSRNRRSPSSSARNSPATVHGARLRVFNGGESDSSTEDEGEPPARPPRYTPHPSPGETEVSPGSNPRTGRSTPRATPHPTPRASPRVESGNSTGTATSSQESFTTTGDTNQVQIVINNSTMLLSNSTNSSNTNVIRVVNDNNNVSLPRSQEPEVTQSLSSGQPHCGVLRHAQSSAPSTHPQPSTTNTTQPQQPRRYHHRGVSTASEFSELSRFSSRESDTFSTDSLESIGCGVTIVHITPSAANMPPPANMTDVTNVPSHRRLPSSQSNSSGISANHEAVAMDAANNAIVTSDQSPRRLSRSSPATRTSESSNPSFDEIQPIRTSGSSTSSSGAEAVAMASAASVSVQNTQKSSSSPKRPAPPTPKSPAPRPPMGEWVTHVPTPQSARAPSRCEEANVSIDNSSNNRTVVAVEPDSIRRRQQADAISIGGQSIFTRQSERNSISGYSGHFDTMTLSSVVYVTSDGASDTGSIGS